jgi:hypothetical protein
MADQLFRLLAQLDSHFAADDQLPADGARWRELKRHVTRMKDGLDLACIELENHRSSETPARLALRPCIRWFPV